MAVPTVTAGAVFPTTPSTTNTSTPTCNLPSGSGGILMTFAVINPTTTTVTAEPWGGTSLLDANNSTASMHLHVSWKRATGTETTANAGMTLSTSTQVAVRVLRINGEHTTQAPEAAATASTGGDLAPNSPSYTTSWAADDNLWISSQGFVNGTTSISTYPSGYTAYTGATGDKSNTANASSCVLGVAALGVVASATEDPGAYANSGTARSWVAQTIVVRPAAAAAGVEPEIISPQGIPYTFY